MWFILFFVVDAAYLFYVDVVQLIFCCRCGSTKILSCRCGSCFLIMSRCGRLKPKFKMQMLNSWPKDDSHRCIRYYSQSHNTSHISQAGWLLGPKRLITNFVYWIWTSWKFSVKCRTKFHGPKTWRVRPGRDTGREIGRYLRVRLQITMIYGYCIEFRPHLHEYK